MPSRPNLCTTLFPGMFPLIPVALRNSISPGGVRSSMEWDSATDLPAKMRLGNLCVR